MTRGGFHDTVGIEARELGDGEAEAVLDAGDAHLNAGGTVHGGAIATLVDTAMGMAVFSTTAEGERPVTIEMKVNYLEPAHAGVLRARAIVRKRGKKVTVMDAEVTQGDDVVAIAMGTFTTVG